MRTRGWRPSTALKKRRTRYLSLLDASGVAAIFVFFVAMYSVMSAPAHDLMHDNVDLATTAHPKPLPAAMKEDAITVVITRDGSLHFGHDRVPAKELPRLIRCAYERGSERKVYLKADARAKYGEVKAILELIREAGVHDVALMVEQTPPPLTAASPIQ
jgi:biopolymer transport protein TolR